MCLFCSLTDPCNKSFFKKATFSGFFWTVMQKNGLILQGMHNITSVLLIFANIDLKMNCGYNIRGCWLPDYLIKCPTSSHDQRSCFLALSVVKLDKFALVIVVIDSERALSKKGFSVSCTENVKYLTNAIRVCTVLLYCAFLLPSHFI